MKPPRAEIPFGYNQILPGYIPRDMADDGHFDNPCLDPAAYDWRDDIGVNSDYDDYLCEEAEHNLAT